MSYIFRALLIVFLCSAASAQTVTVSGTQLTDSSQNAVSNASIIFAPVLSNGRPASYRRGGSGGQTVVKPISAPVSVGAFSVTLADTALTMPANICYSVTVVDNVTGRNLLGDGYGCVQPSTTASWCTGTVCNFDTYQPNLAPLVSVQTGPQGPKGDPGTASVSTANGTSGSWAIPGTLSNGSGAPPALPGNPTSSLQAATKQYADASGGVWQRQGTIMVGGSGEQYSAQEPSVLYENGLFEMWFTCGWTVENLCYATSPDGINWTRLNSGLPVINNVAHGFVLKVGSTYYYYAAILPASTNFGRWHSSDGITWVGDTSTILPSTGSGWESAQRGNIFVWFDGTTWHALFEALGSDTVWRTGYATSSDGLSWTEASGNPKIEYGANGMCGGPEAHLVSGTYYIWEQCSPNSFQPTDIYRFQSTDLNTFTRSPSWPVLARTTADEGPGSFLGQVADASMVEVNGSTYMFYDATDNQSPVPGDGIHIKLAIAPMTIPQLITTNEGSKDLYGLVANAVDGPYGYFGPQYNSDSNGYTPHVPPAGRSFDAGTMSLLGISQASGLGFNCHWDGTVWRITQDGACSVIAVSPFTGTLTILGTPTGGPANSVATLVQAMGLDASGNITTAANINMQSLGVTQRLVNAAGFQGVGGTVGCTTAATAGATCTSSALAWPVSFVDANYLMTCTVNSTSGQAALIGQTKSSSTFTLTISALTANATTGTYNCIGIHN